MHQSPSWRDLLEEAQHSLQVRIRIAKDLGVTPITLTRWIKGEVTPQERHLRNLPSAIPEYREQLQMSLEREFPNLFSSHSSELATFDRYNPVPSEFYARVLHDKAMTPEQLRFSSLAPLILQQGLKQLDPLQRGMEIVIALCLPALHGHYVRSLHIVLGRGTRPFKEQTGYAMYLVGAESLIGTALSAGRIQFNQWLADPLSRSAGFATPGEVSAAATPIMSAGKVAGSLCASSTQKDHFSPPRLALLEQYADLLAVLIDLDDFYEHERIALGVIPYPQLQKPSFSTFQQRVSDLLQQAYRERRPLTVLQAQRRILQDIEEELLQLSITLAKTTENV